MTHSRRLPTLLIVVAAFGAITVPSKVAVAAAPAAVEEALRGLYANWGGEVRYFSSSVDLNGDGRSDVVANDNSRAGQRQNNATPGVHVLYAPDDPVNGEWKYQRIEEKFAMNGCVGADINRDKRTDLVCTGAGGAIRWYENLGK